MKLLALFISTCKFHQEAGTCCWPQRFLSSTPSSTPVTRKTASLSQFSQAGWGQDMRDFKLSASVQWCKISRGFSSPDEQSASSSQDACFLIECMLDFAFWRKRCTGIAHLNPLIVWLLLNNHLFFPHLWRISIYDIATTTDGLRAFFSSFYVSFNLPLFQM